MPLDADDILKISTMLNEFLRRGEYVVPHKALEDQVTQNKADIRAIVIQEQAAHEKLSVQFSTNIDKVMLAIQEVSKQADEAKADLAALRTEIYQQKAEGGNVTLRYIVSVVVSFVIGIVMFLVGVIATKWH